VERQNIQFFGKEVQLVAGTLTLILANGNVRRLNGRVRVDELGVISDGPDAVSMIPWSALVELRGDIVTEEVLLRERAEARERRKVEAEERRLRAQAKRKAKREADLDEADRAPVQVLRVIES
jgi:hypothetical protein